MARVRRVKRPKSGIESDLSFATISIDGYGMTALAYAARNGHVEVVRQLLSRGEEIEAIELNGVLTQTIPAGAERTEVLEQGYGRSNTDIARLLEEESSGSTPSEAQVANEANAHQGMPMQHHMNEGPFINGAMYPPQGYPMMPGYGSPLPNQQYFYDAPPGSAGRVQGHSRKESAANLPPTEVARSIPCRYFPNCRYGDKCMFAHPIMAMPHAGPPGSAPISPSMSQPAMQPIFYPHMPAAYPYPGPYGAGPQFYPSMGPLQSPYGMAAPYSQTMMQPPPPQQQRSEAGQPASNDNNDATQRKDDGLIASSSSQATPEADVQPAISSLKIAAEETPNERGATSTPPQQDGAATLTASMDQHDGGRGTNGAEEPSTETAQGKPVHRRQSFNSFLHHHAVPFQPTVLPPTGDMGMMSTTQAFAPRMGPKGRRPPGANGAGKRNNGERSACMFFARGGCKFGDECRFPHLLTDGTDARPMQAQQRQVYASAYGVVNPALRLPGSGVSDVPASAPTGPQAEKKAASEKQQHQQQQQQQEQQENHKTSQPLQTKSTSQQSSSAASGAAGVVPSIPSKTSSGTGPTSSSRGTHNKKQQHNHHQQSQHQQPMQPAQRVPTVNDFPALAVSSPNLGGQASASPSSPSEPAASVQATSSSTANGDVSSPVTNTHSTTSNGKRANFSAILSAPAPPKAKAPADAQQAKAASAEEGSQENSNGLVNETQAKVNGNNNGINKDLKPRPKESKTVKVDSYKSAVVSPSPASKATVQQDDDFQLVHRSRNSNPSSNQSKAVAA